MSRINILSLATELRLQIGEHIFSEPHDLTPIHLFNSIDGAIGDDCWPDADWRHSMWLNEKYSSNLQVLLVCRRFHDDFTNLAYERTRFVLPVWPAIRVGKIPSDKVHLIRKLAIASDWANICEWTQYPFNNLNIHLDELIVAFNDNSYDPRMVETLRSLRNVKMLGFVRNENYDARSCQIILYKLIGALLQKDHWCRYDAPNGPHIEKTWWDWRFDEGGYGVQLFAREPEPAMPEKEYLALMQPRIDEVMAGMARASS